MTRILVVDDSPIDRRLAGRLLVKESDWVIDEAGDGKEALARIRENPPTVVVTDLNMPEVDGLQLVEELKSIHPEIPAILMTSMGSEEIAIKALRIGAAGYVPKRRLAEDLHAAVSRILVTLRQTESQLELLNRLTRFECGFCLENNAEKILSVPPYVQKTLKAMRLMDENEYIRMSVAIEEALLNALYHGNLEVKSELLQQSHEAFFDLARRRTLESPYRERRVFFNVRVTPGEAVFTIRDQGPGFDPSKLPDPTAPGNFEVPHGRGVLLMRSFMDEVVYNAKGNEVTLVKKRTAPALEELTLMVE
jgi:DNA-binding NarL/FixJ family response regulator/anti-sigma regulatory factor (Ser/Thr protein kinase)